MEDVHDIICESEISPTNYRLITHTDGGYVIDNNNILLQRIKDGALTYVDIEIVMKAFQLDKHNISECLPSTSEMSVSISKPADDTQIRTAWTRDEILNLINLYQEKQEKFKSTCVKNDKIWYEISTSIPNHTWEQCKNKFKYLKGKYIEKKDNMGTKASGAKAIKFDYFQEMDKVFGTDPNVIPTATASSSRGIKNLEPVINSSNLKRSSNDTEGGPKPSKEIKLSNEPAQHPGKGKKKKDISMDSIREFEIMKENGKNRRHNERLEVQREFIDVLKDLVNTFKKT